MKVKIVIPCYNEEKRLQTDLFIEFAKRHPEISLVFANDGSSDNTKTILNALKSSSENIEFLDFTHNQGKANVIQAAITQLLQEKSVDFFGYWDADLATPLEEIPLFLDIFEQNKSVELVLGARVNTLGTDIVRKKSRHYIGRIFATFVSTLLKLPVYDTQCGAKVFTRKIAEVGFKEPFISKWLFDVEFLLRILQSEIFKNKGIKIFFEKPLKKWHDIHGSKLKFLDFLKAPFQLLRLAIHYKK